MPALPVYNGPKMTANPSTVAPFADFSGPAWTNTQNLQATALGLARQMIPAGAVFPTDVGDQLLCRYPIPPGQEQAIILGWSHTFVQIHAERSDTPESWTKGQWWIAVQVVEQTAASGASTLTLRGQIEASHEMNGPSEDWAFWMDYPIDATGRLEIIDNMYLFSRVSLLGNTCLRFQDWAGLALWTFYAAGTSTVDAFYELEALEATVWYVPAPTGEIVVPVNAGTVVAVTAASAGIALDGNWGAELAWTTPANARTADTTRATCVTADNATEAQTQFLSIPISALAFTQVLSEVRELRVRWKGSINQNALLVAGNPAFVTVAELALCKSDGTVLVKGTDGFVLYDAFNFKVVGLNGTAANTERERDVVLDIRSLTGAQLTDLNANGGSVRIRWRIYNPGNTDTEDPQPITLSVNSAIVTLVGGAAVPILAEEIIARIQQHHKRK